MLKAQMQLLSEGTVYRGIVRDVASFGLFIELIPGQQEGVLHFHQTPYEEIARSLNPGQTVEVVATTVDVEREVVRVKLLPDPTRYQGFWPRSKSNMP